MRYYQISFKDYQVSEQDIAYFLAAMPNGIEMIISPFEHNDKVTTKNSEDVPLPEKYSCNVKGDTKLVRKNEEIFLAKRRKKTDNTVEEINYPDAILITDEEKNQFITYCKDMGLSQYKIKKQENTESYKVWSDFINANYRKNYYEQTKI